MERVMVHHYSGWLDKYQKGREETGSLFSITVSRIAKIFELTFLRELTPLPSPALRLVFCTPLTHTQRIMGSTGCGGEAMDWKYLLAYITGTVDQELLLRIEYLVTENQQLPLSSRRNGLPMKRIYGSLLMRHEHAARALVELMQIGKTPSGADPVLHHPPEPFDGIEMVATMSRQ
jgi:hypothetical protein